VLFEQALETAKFMLFTISTRKQDDALKIDKEIMYQEGKELFGVPVSFKDMMMLKGTDTTFGLASRLMRVIKCY
jgi:Asp-tRNA(Asn)/Glu-tRNA(Gln) amidotransferase A subunit family amidase